MLCPIHAGEHRQERDRGRGRRDPSSSTIVSSQAGHLPFRSVSCPCRRRSQPLSTAKWASFGDNWRCTGCSCILLRSPNHPILCDAEACVECLLMLAHLSSRQAITHPLLGAPGPATGRCSSTMEVFSIASPSVLSFLDEDLHEELPEGECLLSWTVTVRI